MAEFLTLIVRAATAGDGGQRWVSALTCQRRPGRRPCNGHLAVRRSDVPPSIRWQCTSCRDEGVISGWERSPFDLRDHQSGDLHSRLVQLIVADDVVATLRKLTVLDSACARLVFRVVWSEDGAALVGDDEDLDELIGYVAAEANHEEDRKRQKRLDAAYEALNDALNTVSRSPST